MFYFGYVFFDDVDYLAVIVSYFICRNYSPLEMTYAYTHLAPCHDHSALTCIALHLEHPALPLICTYASYRFAGE